MSDIEKIIFTSSATIIGGVVVFSVTQIILRFIIDPLDNHRKVIADIGDALVFYAYIYSNPGVGPAERIEEAHIRFRQLASILRVKTHLVAFYGLFHFLKLIPSLMNVKEASTELIFISNGVFKQPRGLENQGIKNGEAADKIASLLHLKVDIH